MNEVVASFDVVGSFQEYPRGAWLVIGIFLISLEIIASRVLGSFGVAALLMAGGTYLDIVPAMPVAKLAVFIVIGIVVYGPVRYFIQACVDANAKSEAAKSKAVKIDAPAPAETVDSKSG